MKANRALVLAGLAALAACAPKPAPKPVPAPAPAPIVRPAPLPAPPPRDWRDAPASPGDWSWALAAGRSTASFGLAGQPAQFTLACDRAAGSVVLTRSGAPVSAPMAIYTTSASRSFAAVAVPGGTAASLPARDPFLDAIAFSRGRFAVELAGAAPLYLPSWPEVSRVIEDCR